MKQQEFEYTKEDVEKLYGTKVISTVMGLPGGSFIPIYVEVPKVKAVECGALARAVHKLILECKDCQTERLLHYADDTRTFFCDTHQEVGVLLDMMREEKS